MIEAPRVLFGRQRGRPLSAGRRQLMSELLPRLGIKTAGSAPADTSTLFEAPVEQVVMEIGFGAGEHLIEGAADHPTVGYIGVEPFINGLSKAVSEVDRLGLRNIRLYDDDAAGLLDWLPGASVARIDLLYPDPWPKRRHSKRRFISPENLDRAARVLAPGAAFHVATDIPAYAEWTLIAFRDHPAFTWPAREGEDLRRPFVGWTGTRYEAKALSAGRRPVYLRFRRT